MSPQPLATVLTMDADAIIAHLDLARHPEGGWYRQTWVADNSGRPTGTCIYFLLRKGESSHWHRVDAAELWLWHAGAPLVLSQADTTEGPARDDILGPDLMIGQSPQLLVPQGNWQTARTLGDWTLVSCAVSPGFWFAGFELAEPGFDISRD